MEYSLVERVRAEFIEMPGLHLTLPQAARLWGLEPGVATAFVLRAMPKPWPRRKRTRPAPIAYNSYTRC
jgi:hypothetical protein